MIRQFDVFDNPSERLRSQAPYIVTIQSHFLDALRTRVVAPLFRPEAMPPERGLILPVQFDGTILSLNIAMMANIEAHLLRRPRRTLIDYEIDIRRAIDRLLTGF